jgi:hypothetical protein
LGVNIICLKHAKRLILISGFVIASRVTYNSPENIQKEVFRLNIYYENMTNLKNPSDFRGIM